MRFKAFLKRFQIEYLVRVLKDASARFPLSVLCAAAGTILCLLEAHEAKLLSDDNFSRVMFFLSIGLVFFTAARLFAEGRALPRMAEAAVVSAGLLALMALSFVPAHFSAMHLFCGAALSLSMLFAPYLGRDAREDSVWYFNYRNGVALVIAGVSTVILCLGLCAIIGSMDYLIYDMKLSGKIYCDIWIFGFGFFGPVMFLHQIPRQFDYAGDECAIPGGVWFIANYLVVPLILIYMWVLYVYFLKIAVQWELPKGNLAYMVTGFGAFGAAAWLAVFPMRTRGTRLLQQFHRYFYPILVVPLILLAIGLYTRVSQYGVTEERYAIGLCLGWLALLTVWFIARPARAHLKHVPMVLAALFLVAAFGPWGAASLSTHSQSARLERLLVEAGVLSPAGIAKTEKEVPFAVRKDISSILSYFYEGKEEAIARWVDPFRAEVDKKYKLEGNAERRCGARSFTRCWDSYGMPEKIMEAWGMKYVHAWEEADSNRFSIRGARPGGQDDAIVKIAPYAYMTRLSLYTAPGGWTEERTWRENGQEGLKATFAFSSAGDFSITLPDGRSATFPLAALATELQGAGEPLPDNRLDRLVLRHDSGGLSAELRISELRGRMEEGRPVLEGASLLLLFSP